MLRHVPALAMLVVGCARTVETRESAAPSSTSREATVRHSIATAWHTCARSRDGHAWCWGDGHTRPVKVPGVADVAGVATTQDTSCAQTTAGTVTCWRGVTGVPVWIAELANVVELVGSNERLCARTSDGAVACMHERNDGGGLSRVEKIAFVHDSIEVVLGESTGCSRDRRDRVTCWLFPMFGRARIARIDVPAAAGATSLAIIGSGRGTLFALVSDGVRRIALDEPTVSQPISAPPHIKRLVGGTRGMCALGDAVTCWDDQLRATAIPASAGATDLAVGRAVTCLRTAAGRPACWGMAEGIGDGSAGESTTPSVVPGLDDVVELAAVGRICARRSTGQIACWGPALDEHGGVDARPVTVQIPFAVGLVVGPDVACARDRNADVWCWGFDVLHPDSERAVGPQKIDALHGAALLVPLLSTICGIVNGVSTCVGAGGMGRDLVPDGTTAVWRGGSIVCARTSGPTVRCGKDVPAEVLDFGHEQGWAFNTVDVGTDVTAVGMHSGHPCIIGATGAVRCEDANSGVFPLRPMAPVPDLTDVVAITDRCVLYRDGGVACGDRDEPLTRLPGIRATALVGDDFGCALLGDHGVACWGQNDYLGNGARSDRETPTELLLEI